VTLNGTVNPNGSEAKTYFEYGTTTAYGSKTTETNAGSGTSAVEKNIGLSGLSPNTTYHYRMVANNENPATSYGSDMTFTTVGLPGVTTKAGEPDPATGKAATLNAFIDPNGQSTTYQFEYGTTSGVYTTTVPIPAESAGSELTGKAVSYKISGLTRGTQYYFRVTATNASGKVNGAQESFVTQDVPTATTGKASALKVNGATLNGVVGANGLTTKYQFEYGTTTSYGSKAPVSPVTGSGSVGQEISGLAAGTLYHFRLVAENAFGTTYGADATFTTLATPPVITLNVEGKPVAVGTTLRAVGNPLSFAGVSCPGTEFIGEVSKNPGATQSIATAKVQGAGGAKCTYGGLYEVKFEVPTKGITIEYTTNETGEAGFVTFSKFTLLGTVTFGGTPVGTCEYQVSMSGNLPLGGMIVFGPSGTVSLVKSTGTCPPSGAPTGKIRLKSGETAVEAKV